MNRVGMELKTTPLSYVFETGIRNGVFLKNRTPQYKTHFCN
jgi:hypothetical protein